MTIKELEKLTFKEAVEILEQEQNTLTNIDTLKSFIIDNVKEDMYFLAIHILKAINDSTAYYFDYDYCMGTLDTPCPIEKLEDLKDYCEN